MNKKIIDQINQISKDLKLPSFSKHLQTTITEGLKQNATYEEVILSILTREVEQRNLNREKARLRNAGFPQLKYLQDLDGKNCPKMAKVSCPNWKHWTSLSKAKISSWEGAPEPGKRISPLV